MSGMEGNKMSVVKLPSPEDEDKHRKLRNGIRNDIRSIKKGHARTVERDDLYYEMRPALACVDCHSEIDTYLKIVEATPFFTHWKDLRKSHPSIAGDDRLIGITVCTACWTMHAFLAA